MNGFAAGLTNCITRDGQSPPSADLPMGGKKLTNLGLATAATDALSQAAGDARYAGLASPALTGTPTAPTATGGTNTTQIATTAYVIAALVAYAPLASPTFTGTVTVPTPTTADNTTKAASTAYVQANLASYALTSALAAYAPLASPTLTGVPVAPTAAVSTNTTQIATTAFVAAAIDPLLDVTQHAKSANYQLALTDRGAGVDFNGTSLTCTIPANGSVAFPLGSTILLTNLNATSLSVAITTDTLTLAGSTTTGTRTLAQSAMATLRKVTATSWLISGAGVT